MSNFRFGLSVEEWLRILTLLSLLAEASTKKSP